MAPLAKQLLGQADAIKNVFTEQALKQRFNLGVTKGLGVRRVCALINDFTNALPSLELTLVPQNAHCDARIIVQEELKENEIPLTLWKEEYLLALPNNHLLSLKESISIADLDGLPFIQRTPCRAWDDLIDILTLAGASVDIRAKIQTIDYALGLVSAGLGCALVPAYSEILTRPDIVLKPINELRLTREVVLAYQQNSDVIDILRHIVNKHRRSSVNSKLI